MPAANFYARYNPGTIPQGVKNGDHDQDIKPRPAKRKRLTIADDGSVTTHPNGRSSHADITEVTTPTKGVAMKDRRHEKEQLRKVKLKQSTNGNGAESNFDDKHKSIRTKYKQASKESEAAAKSREDVLPKNDEDVLEVIHPVGLQPLPQPKRVHDEPKAQLSALPDWMVEPVRASNRLPFADLGLSPELSARLSQEGFKIAFPVQTTVIAMLMKRDIRHSNDICVSASTGSGKTLAYTLPIIEALKDKPVTRLRALIIVPTRELVNQVKEVFRITRSSLKVGTAVGSISLKDERKKLIEIAQVYDPEAHREIYGRKETSSEGWDAADMSSEDDTDDELPMHNHVIQRSSKVDVLICTPGRLVDHLRSTKGFSLKHIQWLVIDEADRLLDQSFQQWIDIVMPQLERKPTQDQSIRFNWSNHVLMPYQIVRKIVLSATMTRDYSKVLALELKNPTLVVTEGIEDANHDDKAARNHKSEPVLTSVPGQLTEAAVAVKDAAEKPLYLIKLIETESTVPQLANVVNGATQTHSFKNKSNTSSSSEESSSDESENDSLDSSVSSSRIDTSDETSSSGESSDDAEDQKETSGTNPNYGFLVFVNTTESALRLCRLLVILRPSWSARILPLTKSVGTSSGRKALAAFRQRKADIIVATDLASRGLDLKNLAQVVNYDMPKSLTTYIHRIGRTARAGKSGNASTLVCHHEARWFWKEIGRSANVERTNKVGRKELHLDASDKEAYEKALETLGREAKGST